MPTFSDPDINRDSTPRTYERRMSDRGCEIRTGRVYVFTGGGERSYPDELKKGLLVKVEEIWADESTTGYKSSVKKYGKEDEGELLVHINDLLPQDSWDGEVIDLRDDKATSINAFGFEIEGEFSSEAFDKLKEWGRFVDDGSLNRCSSDEHEKSLNCSEFVSDVIQIDDMETALDVFSWFKNHPKDYHWNDSAGLHIHVSFNPPKPPEIVSKKFYDEFINKVNEEYPEVIEERVDNDENRYCNRNKNYKEIYKATTKYKDVNYSSLNGKGTIEFRLWGANKPEIMEEYLIFTIKFIQDYLDNDEIKNEVGEMIELDMIENEIGFKNGTVEIKANNGKFVPIKSIISENTPEDVKNEIAEKGVDIGEVMSRIKSRIGNKEKRKIRQFRNYIKERSS